MRRKSAISDESSKPVIAYDDREKDKDLLWALTGHFTLVRKHLKSGDYAWQCPLGFVGIENKTSDDLTGSATNKRLDDELRRLVAAYTLPILFVRNTHLSPYSRWSGGAVENLLLGRQLHGVYVYRAAGTPQSSAAELRHLYDYLSRPHSGGIDGVRRPPMQNFQGPLGLRAEAIYAILGYVQGIRNRRAIAERIAEITTVREFLSWSVSDFVFSGFSLHMARKLVFTISNMEGTTLAGN